MAKDGYLDLSGWDFHEKGNVNLNGEWDFYWNHLLDPEDFDSGSHPQPAGTAVLPGVWNGKVVDGRVLSGDGYATYHLRVKVSPDKVVKAIRIKNQSSAYALFINGKIVVRNGVVGNSPEAVIPQYRLEQRVFYETSENLDIILQVANFNHRRGGICYPITLGDAEDLQSEQSLHWILDLSLFGCLFVMGTYYLSLYALFRKDNSLLYLAIFTLSMAVRILVSGNYYLTQVFPFFPWETQYTIELLTIVVGPAGLLLFVSSLYPQKKRDGLHAFLLCCLGVFGLVALLMPGRISSHVVAPCQLIILIIFAYSLYILVRALLGGDIKAGILLFGMIILTGTVIIDISSANKIFYFKNMTHFGFLFLIFSQSFVLSMRFSDSFRQVSRLTQELAGKNVALERLDRLKDEFLANTTHELRTPLNGMVGMAENMLLEVGESVPQATRVNLQTIITSGRRLGSLINDVLDFSRLKNSDVTLNPAPIDLNSLINVVFSVLQPLAEKKSLKLVKEMYEKLPPIWGDEERLQQIFFNLVGNAIKFSDNGSIRVWAVLSGPSIVVSIMDSGIGIAGDRLKDIFKPYEQEGGGRDRRYGGTGLGLAITKKLVNLHGGTLEVQSTQGKGSIFTLSLPCSREHEKIPTIYPIPPECCEETLYGSRTEIESQIFVVDDEGTEDFVLVVDDDLVNRQVVANHLRTAGLSFATASSGIEALSFIQNSRVPALVLLDIMMPNMNGYEVCRKLRLEYDAAELPIILLTARSGMENLLRGFEVGANDYLTKPFARDELLARVRTQIQLRNAYTTLKENLLLKIEIERRKRTGHDLLLIQEQLAGILDSVADAIVAVNRSHEISYVNHQMSALSGYEIAELLGRPISSLFAIDMEKWSVNPIEQLLESIHPESEVKEGQFTLIRKNDSQLIYAAEVVGLETGSNQRLVLILIRNQVNVTEQGSDQSSGLSILKIVKSLHQTRQKMQLMEDALQTQPPHELKSHVGKDVKLVLTALAEMEMNLAGGSNDMQKKLMAVEAMNLAVEYWQESAQLTKADLANQSGIWKVYINQDGFERTQTLDKYLDTDRFPKQPRWQKIIDTVQFVLLTCQTPSPLRVTLEERLLQLELSK